MITVEQAEKLILENVGDFGAEIIPIEQAFGRVLAENIKMEGEVVLTPSQVITPIMVNVVASVGETELRVKRLPKAVILSFGDELVGRSNSYMIKATLTQLAIDVSMLHIPEEPEIIQQKIQECLQHYDVILVTGDTSTAKFDNVLQVLNRSGIEKLLYKIKQYPGESFWFGKHENGLVAFAFPGDSPATLVCMHRYFIPWLNASLAILPKLPVYAIFDQDFTFELKLQCFLPVKLKFNQQGQLLTTPVEGSSSDNIVSLTNTDAFMELPLEKNEFKRGEVYRIWLLA